MNRVQTPLPAAVDELNAEDARRRLAGSRFGRQIAVHGTVQSTNDLARRLGRDGAADGAVVIAAAQAAGRGRRARHWASAAGKGIYCSVLLRPGRIDAAYAAAVQLAAGIAVAEAARPLLPSAPELLWPNDCLCRGQKLAGVLVESESTGNALEFLVCGIGINVTQAAADFPSALRGKAASIATLAGEAPARMVLLTAVLRAFEYWDDRARTQGASAVIERWLELAPSARDHGVEVETLDGLLTGITAGLSAAGGLLVSNERGLHEVLAGELVRVRRRK